MIFRRAYAFIALFFLLLIPAPLAAKEGPGIPPLHFGKEELFKVIGKMDKSTGTRSGHSLLTMHRGYLFMIESRDGGGGDGSFSWWDISNPRQPKLHYKHYTEQTKRLRESHTYGHVHINGNDLGVFMTRKGLQIWNLNEIKKPVLVSEINLDTMKGGDYSGTPWWIAIQGRYVYVGGTTTGLHLVDISHPENPVQLRRLPLSQTGGFRIGPTYALGNLLVITSMDTKGISTFDISDPKNPVLLDKLDQAVGYAALFNGGYLYGGDTIPKCWDIRDPKNITLASRYQGKKISSKGGYASYQDGFVHQGVSGLSAFIDYNDPTKPQLVGTINSGVKGSDLDGANIVGNLAIASCDHSKGSFISPHRMQPDDIPPRVTMVSPADQASGQALTARIGINFSDQLASPSISPQTLIVRELGGKAIAGTVSNQTNILHFHPRAPLKTNTTYEVVIPKGGITDQSGNAVAETFRSTFSTGQVVSVFPVTITRSKSTQTGSTVHFSATSQQPGASYSWDFGDGTPATPYSSTAAARHVFTQAGHYSVIVTARTGTGQSSATTTQVVYNPPTAARATMASTISYDPSNHIVWNVNQDNNSITATDARKQVKTREIKVPGHPRTLAIDPSGKVWVTCQDDGVVCVVDSASESIQTIPLPYGSRPFGIALSPDNAFALVTGEGSGKVYKIDGTSMTVTGTVSIGGKLRGVAISGDGRRALVTRFVSPAGHGEVVAIKPATMQRDKTIPLALDTRPDTEDNGRGVPNYLSFITISPDGKDAWIPSKKDNTGRGLARDGKVPTFESSVRTIISRIDLDAGEEVYASRIDFNDRDMAQGLCFSPNGEMIFVTMQGSNIIEVMDPNTSRILLDIHNTGKAPQGVCISPDGNRLFVHNFMSRDIVVYDVSNIIHHQEYIETKLATVATVSEEKLTPEQLLGKQIFYDSSTAKMSREGYISCASCHLDGGNDGRVWDFTNRGEGLRNTIELNGRAGTRHGRVHWTANFDEIQDFEHDIRGPFEGDGFIKIHYKDTKRKGEPMTASDFAKFSPSLGKPKKGMSKELDALAAFHTTLTSTHPSPHRNNDGKLTDDGKMGRAVFNRLQCYSCHGGETFTDSPLMYLHDVGTLSPSSGKRMNGPLPGLDTPTLRGIWETAPYLHDGSAATLMDVITTQNPDGKHGPTHTLTETEKKQLVAYLLQIDNTEEPAKPNTPGQSPYGKSIHAPHQAEGGGHEQTHPKKKPQKKAPITTRAQGKHEFVCIDNARNNLIYVNQYDPKKGWQVKIPAGSRDLQRVEPGVILVGHGNGCAEYQLATGEKTWEIKGQQGTQSARRLSTGHTLLAKEKSMIVVDRSGRTVETISSLTGSKLSELRLVRPLKNGHFLRTGKAKDYLVIELDQNGKAIWQAPLTGKGYLAERLANGNTLATTGHTCTVIEINPSGKVVKTYAGRKAFPKANLQWFSGFHLQDNGNIVVANWLGHGQKGKGPHLVEFSPQNQLIWSWTDHAIAQQITHVLILR